MMWPDIANHYIEDHFVNEMNKNEIKSIDSIILNYFNTSENK